MARTGAIPGKGPARPSNRSEVGSSAALRPRFRTHRPPPAFGPSSTGGEATRLGGLPVEPADDRALARMLGLAALGGIAAWAGLGVWLF